MSPSTDVWGKFLFLSLSLATPTPYQWVTLNMWPLSAGGGQQQARQGTSYQWLFGKWREEEGHRYQQGTARWPPAVVMVTGEHKSLWGNMAALSAGHGGGVLAGWLQTGSKFSR